MSNQQQKINIKLDEAIGEGIYSNIFLVTNSPAEFIIDFGRILPGLAEAKIYSRIVMTPQHAKQLQKALETNIANYEKQNGEIKINTKSNEKEIGFKSYGQNS